MPPVRESRHLWVGNIPDSVSEEKLVEHFERYGRIDSIKLLNKRSSDGGQAAFVDFVDIRCAIKAHQTPNRLGDRELRTDYNEPASTTLTRTHVESSRRYERAGGRGPGDEGYGSRQADAYGGNYSYKDDPPHRREYDRGDNARAGSRGPEESSAQYRHHPIKSKDSDSGQSGSGGGGGGSPGSGSGTSDSSDSGDSESDSDSGSSVSEPQSSGKKPTALQIRNLSARSADSTIREGLYHEFKKHGEVGQIKVFGRDSNRSAIVYFRRPEDVVKAIDSCRGKMFLGLEMDLAPYDDDHYEGTFHRYRRRNEGGGGGNSFGAAEDVFLFNATRTIFVGNIERNTTQTELKRMFERYGDIVDVDIKKQGSNGAYAFIQFLDITHAVEAKKQMNRAAVGRTRLKIGFGKGMPTSTLWIGGLPPGTTEQTLERHFHRYGRILRVGVDRERSYAMVTFDNIDSSTLAHNDAKDRPVFGKRVRVDYASRESQHFFYDHLDRTGQGDGRRYEPSPPPASAPPYRQRGGGNKGYDEPPLRSRGVGGMKQDSRGSKYHGYDHGYDRGPPFADGGRGRGYYDDYFRGSGSRGGYESDDFGQELREYNVTRERERERERAREREQDRRQEPPPPPRRRHRERHEVGTESDGERYYSRGEQHSDAWPGESGKERASRESSFEPREEVHRKGDIKRRDGDKRRAEDKKGFMKRYEGQSEEELEPPPAPADRGNRRDKVSRKKVPEIREGEVKGEFYPENFQKPFKGDNKEMAPMKRKVKVEKDFIEGPSADDGKPLPEEITVKIENVKEEKAGRVRKEEQGTEKVTKKVKKEGKKKRLKHKKSPDAPLAPMAALPHPEGNVPEAMDSDGVSVEKSGFEPRKRKVSTKVDKDDVTSEEKKARKGESVVLKSVIVDKNMSEGSDKESREYRQERRPKSPSPEDMPAATEEEQRLSRKRARSPGRGPAPESNRAENTRVKNAKRAGDTRSRNGSHGEDTNQKKGRVSREATPPPPPPPPLPKPKPTSESRPYAKDGFSSHSTDASSLPQTTVVEQPITTRSSREQSMFQPYPADVMASSAVPAGPKHETRAQVLSHPSPTNSPTPAQTGSSTVPNSDDTLMELLRRHPVMWQGLLGLKNDSAAIQMHYVSGNSKLAEYSLPKPNGGTGANGLPIPPVLRIAQRMRMEASQLEGVSKRMQLEKEHCLLLALPCGRDPLDVHAQTRALKTGFIAYLQQKLAAGIINIAQPGSQQASFVLHVFPPCEFSHSHLSRVAPNLLDSATDSGHLMVVVATV